ncbi:MAG: FecCD family ABC transporter permease [Hydrogenovibrio sp.]
MKLGAFGLLFGGLLLTALVSLTLGRYDFAPLSSLQQLGWSLTSQEGEVNQLLVNIMLDVRLPRIIAAVLIGAALAVAGTAFQALFMNPLVSPGVLGVLSGSAFGASLGILLFDSVWMMQLLSFGFGLLAVFIALMLAKGELRNNLTILVLGGMIAGALFTALLSVVKYVADPYNKLPAIVYWLMGSLANVEGSLLLWLAPFMLMGMVLLMVQGHTLNVLSLGDDEARTLGVSVERKRLLVIVLATFLGAITVTLGGMIGWVGLVIPHLTRLLFGADNRFLLPASALIGAIYLLVVDNVARLALTVEIPLGILTALIGLPVFAWALKNVRKGWQP